LLWNDIKALYEYRVTLSAGRSLLATAAVAGRPRRVEAVLVYPRSGGADVDWVVDVPLADPKVMVGRTPYAALRHDVTADGRWRYSTTIEAGPLQSDGVVVVGVTEDDDTPFRIACRADRVVTLDGEAPRSVRLLRATLDRLPDDVRTLVLADVATKHKDRVLGLDGRDKPYVSVRPFVTGDTVVVGSETGDVGVYARGNDEAFRLPRPPAALAERWTFRDGAVNRSDVTGLFVVGDRLVAVLNRGYHVPGTDWWGLKKRKSYTDVVDRVAAATGRDLLGTETLAAEDLVVELSLGHRDRRWRELAASRRRDELLAAGEFRGTVTAWGERAVPLAIPDAVGQVLPGRFHYGIACCLAPGGRHVVASVFDTPGDRQSDLVVTAPFDGGELGFFRLVAAGVGATVQPPVPFEGVVYVLCTPEPHSKLGEVEAERGSSFLYAFDTAGSGSGTGSNALALSWRLELPRSSTVFSRLSFDPPSGRIGLATARSIVVLDARARRDLARSGKDVPTTPSRAVGAEYVIPLAALEAAVAAQPAYAQRYGRCLTSTPIITASPTDRAAGREYLHLSMALAGATDGTSVLANLDERFTLRGRVVIEVSADDGTVRRALPPDATGLPKAVQTLAAAKYAGGCSHLVAVDESTGLVAVAEMGHLQVVRPLASPPGHLVAFDAETEEVEHMTLSRNEVYFSRGRNVLYRIAFSPTRLPSPTASTRP